MDKLECPHCGGPLGNGVTVCGECGKEVPDSQEPSPAPEAAPSQENSPAPEAQPSSRKIYAVLAVFLVVVGGVALLLFTGLVPNPLTGVSTAAVVNGEKISQEEVNQKFEMFKKIYGQNSQMDFSSPEGQKMMADMKRQVLNTMIQEKILLTEAVKEKIVVSPQDISSRIDAIKKAMNLADKDFEAFIKSHGMDMKGFEKRIEKEALINKLIAKGTEEKGLTKDAWLTMLNERAKVEVSMK